MRINTIVKVYLVYALLFLDCTTKQIGEKLGKEPHTIDQIRSRLRKKFKLGMGNKLPDYLKNLK